MGRYVRAVLRDLAARAEVGLTLLVRDPHNAPAYRAIAGEVEVADLAAGRTRRDFDAVWYPWNGIRFTARAPAVVTINDDFAFAYPAPGRIARWREQRPIRRAVRRARQILTISEWARRALADRFALDPLRIGVIPLAPGAQFTPGREASPYAEPFVLAVGTREARKNAAFLIDVFGRAFPGGDVRLVLVGSLEGASARAARVAHVPLTTLDGIDDLTLRRLYRCAAVVAVPSLAEGFGLVVAEAQACGAAVLAADRSALPEVIGDAGLVCDPRDATAWIAGLRLLVRDDALAAVYRARAVARWPPALRERTADAVLAALQRTGDDRP